MDGKLEGEGGGDGEAVEVAEHKVAVLVPAEDVVVGGDETGDAVAGCLAHLPMFSCVLISWMASLLTKCLPLRVNTCREWLALSWPVKITWPCNEKSTCQNF